MKKSELTQLIREAVTEVFSEMKETSHEVNEATPPNFPPALKKKLFKKYGQTPKAYATMWTLSKKMNEGDARVKEMWMQFENKKEVNEVSSGKGKLKANVENDVTSLAPADLEKIADEYNLVTKFHGMLQFGLSADEFVKRYTVEFTGDIGQLDAFMNRIIDDQGDAIEFQDVVPVNSVNEEDASADQDAEHDETDLSNPEENKEVELANQIKSLADQLLAMHGAGSEENSEEDATSGEDTGAETAANAEEPQPVAEQKKKSISKKKVKKKSKK